MADNVTPTRQRLDKILVHLGVGSRSQVQKLVRQGKVMVDNVVISDPSQWISPEGSTLLVDGYTMVYSTFAYYMLNKPPGLVSASRGEDVVLDLIHSADKRPGLFPVGRLDKDTEGLLIITNDGQLAHRLLAPKRHVPKRYVLRYEGTLSDDAVAIFARGMELEDGDICLPAELNLHMGVAEETWATVILHEGKFHQVKRMIAMVGGQVEYLQRCAFGPLDLDTSLAPGVYRPLTKEEIAALRKAAISS